MQPPRTPGVSRRRLLSQTAGGAAALTLGGVLYADADQIPANTADIPAIRNGHIKQTVCRWCYAKVPLDELCAAAARFGFKGIDLVEPADRAGPHVVDDLTAKGFASESDGAVGVHGLRRVS